MLYDQWQGVNKELQESLHHTPKYEQTNPIESLSSIAGIFALFGGAMMRNPAIGMLSAAKGILEGQKQNDLDKYTKAMQEFQTNREYLTTVSSNLAKQIDLIQKNQHYTNQEKVAQQRLLFQAMGIQQRGASMMAAADRHNKTMDAQTANRAFTAAVNWANKYDLPADRQNELMAELMRMRAMGTLNDVSAAQLVQRALSGASLHRGPAATSVEAENYQIISKAFDPLVGKPELAKKEVKLPNGMVFKGADYSDALGGQPDNLVSEAAREIRKLRRSALRTPMTGGTVEAARDELPDDSGSSADWSVSVL
jgi:hypothetical protein